MFLLSPKLVGICTFQVFVISFMVSYLDVDIPTPPVSKYLKKYADIAAEKIRSYFDQNNDDGSGNAQGGKKKAGTSKTASSSKEFIVMTPKELAKYDGRKASKGLYLGLLGKIYDVQKGKRHYGPKGGYHFFAGKDATRAFVTGEFNAAGLRDDVLDLGHQDLLGIEEWLTFYEKEYKFIGYLEGTYYDSKGRPTQANRKVMKAIESAHSWQDKQHKETERFPPCNSEWSQNKGGRVWCSNKSGGFARDWVGVPRKLFKPGSSQSRCACVKNTGPPQDSEEEIGDRGDLDHPNLQEYENCDPSAISCRLNNN